LVENYLILTIINLYLYSVSQRNLVENYLIFTIITLYLFSVS
jgi:hypothetical protein